MTGKFWKIGALVAVVSMAGAVPSEADIIFERLGGGTGNNVLFSCPAGDAACATSLTNDDNLLTGTVQNTIYQTLFTANVNIEPGAAGQATIKEVSAATVWTSLELDWLNFDSTNEVVLRIKPTSDDTTIILSACDNLDDCTWTSSPDFTGVDAPAGDFFRLRTINDQWITSVSIAASNGSLSEVEQVRLGDLRDGDDVIPAPEPAVMALFGMGLFAVGFHARRKKTSTQ